MENFPAAVIRHIQQLIRIEQDKQGSGEALLRYRPAFGE